MQKLFYVILSLYVLNFDVLVICTKFSADIVGSILVECGQPVLHSIKGRSDLPGISLPALDSHDSHFEANKYFLPDKNTKCLKNYTEILEYCRNLYDQNKQHNIQHIIIAPFAIPIKDWPGAVHNAPDVQENNPVWVRPYWCVATNTLNYNQSNNSTQIFNNSGQHYEKIPSLIELHRLIFEKQFHNLELKTNETIKEYLKNLTHDTKMLNRLKYSNSKSSYHYTTNMLQRAHRQLESVWLNQENEWSRLEFGEHLDLVKQLTQEDLNGQNEFVYALQEPNPNIHRVQLGLSRFLGALSESVKEELRHLKAVKQFQPWSLSLDQSGNWTASLHQHVTNIYQVHAVLLNCVKRATIAINAFQAFVKKILPQNNLTILHEKSLVKNYHHLETYLNEAKHLLNETKLIVINNLNKQTHFLPNRIINSAHNRKNLTSSIHNRLDGIRTKHQLDFVNIDSLLWKLAGNLILNENNQKFYQPIHNDNNLSSNLNQLDSIWLPRQTNSFTNVASSDHHHHHDYDNNNHSMKNHEEQKKQTKNEYNIISSIDENKIAMCFLFAFLLVLKILVIGLCIFGFLIIIYRLLLINRLSNANINNNNNNNNNNNCPNTRLLSFHHLFWSSTHNLKHWLQSINQSNSRRSSILQKIKSNQTMNDPQSVRISTTTLMQGYENPIYPIFAVNENQNCS